MAGNYNDSRDSPSASKPEELLFEETANVASALMALFQVFGKKSVMARPQFVPGALLYRYVVASCAMDNMVAG
jgi:hypothetical protein